MITYPPGDSRSYKFVERIHGGLVQISVQAHHGKLFDRRTGKRVAKPALEKADLIIEQPVAFEVALNLLERNREFLVLLQMQPLVLRIFLLVRRRQSPKRVGRPHAPVRLLPRPSRVLA